MLALQLALAGLLLLVAAPTAQQRSSLAARGRAYGRQATVSAAGQWFRQMTLRDKIAQLIVAPFYGDNPGRSSKLYRRYASLVRDVGIGGLILVNRVENGVPMQAEPLATAAFLNRMQRLARVPLVVAADFERGASMRVAGSALFPHAMAFAAGCDLEATRRLGAITARQAAALGVHWIFAPVADVNNNPDNPIINIRAFSENPQEVSRHVEAFIDGARSDPAHRVLLTAKHFPGHGDTVTDTHAGLGKLEGSRERIDQVELAPFRAAIAKRVDAIMTSHLWAPALDQEQVPATLSSSVLSGLLRRQMGFTGLIVTDAMDMKAISNHMSAAESAVRALEAGADVLLMPPDPEGTIRAVMAAVRKGRLSRQRIDQSVIRLLEAKQRVGLDKKRLVNLEAVSDLLDDAADAELAARVSARAITLVRNEGRLVPLANPASTCWFLLAESRWGRQGNRLLESLRQSVPEAPVQLVDLLANAADINRAAERGEACEAFVVAAFSGFRGNGSLAPSHERLIELLAASRKPIVLVGLGNPYLLRRYPFVHAFLATFSTVPDAEQAALQALLGESPITGRLPVTIPGAADYGAGLAIARQGRFDSRSGCPID